MEENKQVDEIQNKEQEEDVDESEEEEEEEEYFEAPVAVDDSSELAHQQKVVVDMFISYLRQMGFQSTEKIFLKEMEHSGMKYVEDSNESTKLQESFESTNTESDEEETIEDKKLLSNDYNHATNVVLGDDEMDLKKIVMKSAEESANTLRDFISFKSRPIEDIQHEIETSKVSKIRQTELPFSRFYGEAKLLMSYTNNEEPVIKEEDEEESEVDSDSSEITEDLEKEIDHQHLSDEDILEEEDIDEEKGLSEEAIIANQLQILAEGLIKTQQEQRLQELEKYKKQLQPSETESPVSSPIPLVVSKSDILSDSDIDEWTNDEDDGYIRIPGIKGIDDIFDYVDDIQVEEYPDQQKRDNVDECFDDNVEKMYQRRVGVKLESLCVDDNQENLSNSTNISLNQSIGTEQSESLNGSMITEKGDLYKSIIDSPMKQDVANQPQESSPEEEYSSTQEIQNNLEDAKEQSPTKQNQEVGEKLEEPVLRTPFENKTVSCESQEEEEQQQEEGEAENFEVKTHHSEVEPSQSSKPDTKQFEENSEEDDTSSEASQEDAKETSKYQVLYLPVIHEKGVTEYEDSRDFPIVVNKIIAGRYQILDYLGSAAFSTAVQCLDLETDQLVCVKIIKNNKEFFDQSLDEINILRFINSKGDPDTFNFVQLYDFFYFKEHLFLVCELLRDNLYEFMRYNLESGDELYFTLPRLQKITKQVLQGLEFIHKLNLIHCDLKPENILIKSYSRCEVKIIDFGSSCFTSGQLFTYVQSRTYRAPEVILGASYDQKIDIWSLGCIIAELWTGRTLFDNTSIQTMLAKIAGIIGKFPKSLLKKGIYAPRFFTKEYVLYERSRTNSSRISFVIPKKTSLKKRLNNCEDALFVDFISNCLKIHPKERFSASEALKHPWLSHQYNAV